MKIHHLLLLLLLFNSRAATAQESKSSLLYKLVQTKRQSVKATEKLSLFSTLQWEGTAVLKQTLSDQTFLSVNKVKSQSLYRSKPLSISLIVPFKTNTYQLELVQEDISMNGVPAGKLTGTGKLEKTGKVKAVHYRGYINNDSASIASFSVFENGEIMALFSNALGNFNLGKTSAGKYILYNSEDMKQASGYDCGTDETHVQGESVQYRPQTEPLANPQLLCNKVRLYWEADYTLFNHNFGNNYVNTLNYLTGLFNQVATLFYNEGIIAELPALYVWVTPDTFTTTSSATGLNAIKNKWNSLGNNFDGDLCMLIDGGTTNNGGRAYVLTGGICNRTFAYGYSNVRGNYNAVPTYSWDVEVITHETGHNMGSRHTQSCSWNTGANGTCGAIDDCVSVEATSGCTTCSATTLTNPTPPAGFKGTIMSYCHLRSGIGINFTNGFGPLPGAAIRTNISNSTSCTIQDNKWTGAVSTAWETTGNWSCGTIPGATTDVTIPGGVLNNPVVNSAALCRKLRQTAGAAVTVRTGFSLRVVGAGP